jgi:collagen type VI alpha
MIKDGFSEKQGARPLSSGVTRLAIVITDGESYDDVATAANAARKAGISMIGIGVGYDVDESQLLSIAGSPDRKFVVKGFKELDTRLQSMVQKAACKQRDDDGVLLE